LREIDSIRYVQAKSEWNSSDQASFELPLGISIQTLEKGPGKDDLGGLKRVQPRALAAKRKKSLPVLSIRRNGLY
jgi:hypothetical protein